MAWNARLELSYHAHPPRTVARFRHDGPLRILKSLYPESDGICHNVLVHPPGGLVGGDTLDLQVTLDSGTHGLVTTPGATRFYRSEGEPATQQLHARLADGARLEWLPLEAIAYHQCQALNRAVFELAPGAELMMWDVTALGLPASGQPFGAGVFSQHLEIPGVWLERGRIDAQDTLLMDGALGLAGQRCLATLVFASGSALSRERRERGLDVARERLEAHPLRLRAGVTSPHPQVLVLRTLAPMVEPAMGLLREVWATWRQALWDLPGQPSRLWAL